MQELERLEPIDSGGVGSIYAVDHALARRLERKALVDIRDAPMPASGFGQVSSVIIKLSHSLEPNMLANFQSSANILSESEAIRAWYRVQKNEAKMLKEANNCSHLWGLVPVFYWSGMIEGRRLTCMSYVSGMSGKDVAWRLNTQKQEKTLKNAVKKAAEALRKCGIRHNDLHPGNVMVSYPHNDYNSEPRVTIIDFGMAHSLKHPHPVTGRLATFDNNNKNNYNTFRDKFGYL